MSRARGTNTYKPGDTTLNDHFASTSRASSPSKTRTMDSLGRRSPTNFGQPDNRPVTSPGTSCTGMSTGGGRRSPSPSRCSTPAFKDSISRFDQYASLRNCSSPQTLRQTSAVGPGCYDMGSSFRSYVLLLLMFYSTANRPCLLDVNVEAVVEEAMPFQRMDVHLHRPFPPCW
jgi:hypothetical protein